MRAFVSLQRLQANGSCPTTNCRECNHLSPVMAGHCPGHLRLCRQNESKTWMPATSAGMTTGSVAAAGSARVLFQIRMSNSQEGIRRRSRGRNPTRALRNPMLLRNKEGAGNAGCTLHPRSRVLIARKETHTSIQVQRRQSGIPCAMVLRLMPCSPRRRILVCHRHHADQRANRSGWIDFTSADLAPATGVRTTRFCRTRSAPFVLRARGIAHEMRLALRLPCAPDAAASIASRANVRDDRDAPLLRRGMS